MPKGTLEQVTCQKCDAAVREDTVFCYNCGHRVADDASKTAAPNGSEDDVDARTKAALDDMVERFRFDEAEGDKKLANAAAERRKARGQRKPREFKWEPQDDSSIKLIVLFAVVITVVTAVVVLLTVFWK